MVAGIHRKRVFVHRNDGVIHSFFPFLYEVFGRLSAGNPGSHHWLADESAVKQRCVGGCHIGGLDLWARGNPLGGPVADFFCLFERFIQGFFPTQEINEREIFKGQPARLATSNGKWWLGSAPGFTVLPVSRE